MYILIADILRQTDVDRWAYLNGIHIPHIDAEIELLIGNDAPKVLEPKEIRESKDGGLSTVRTLFGWTINWPLGRMSSFKSYREHLSTQFEKFCEMEFSDSQFTEMMEQSVKLCDGHYEVALPWKFFPQNYQTIRRKLNKGCYR